MDADEERNFAALLSQSTALPARPTWSPPASSSNQAVDPWANPFASSPTDPFKAPSLATPYSNVPRADQSYLPPAASNYDDYNYDNNTNGFDYNPPTSNQQSNYEPSPASGLPIEEESDSPYVQKLEAERMIPPPAHTGIPDPPSVIAARERDQLSWGSESGGFGGDTSGFGGSANAYTGSTSRGADTFTQPFETTPPRPSWGANGHDSLTQIPTPPKPAPHAKAGSRILPADLIDDDLMAASDPSISLKRAFVKSTPAPLASGANGKGKTPEKSKQGAYVFRPAGKSSPVRHEAKKDERAVPAESKGKGDNISPAGQTEGRQKGHQANGHVQPSSVGKEINEGDKEGGDIATETRYGDPHDKTAREKEPSATVNGDTRADEPTEEPPKESEPEIVESNGVGHDSNSIPAITAAPSSPSPARQDVSSTPRPHSDAASIPLPASTAPTRTSTPLPPPHPSSPSPTLYPAQTPTQARVAVSPLEPPSGLMGDGGDFGFKSLSIGGAAVMPPVAEAGEGWGGSPSATASGSRFGGKGWGAMDDNVDNGDEGLFGKGGPVGDPWGGGGGGGWGEEVAVAGPSSPVNIIAPFADAESEPQSSSPSTPTPALPSASPSKIRRKAHPVFSISISDPARVGDPVRGYTVYTIRTQTTSPHYRKSEFTALRRFSDFLWLFDSLIANNPGIIVPPVPDKHTFGRFQEQFIETRRLALERSLNKIASHPVLQLDPDLRLFLESDNFAAEIKGRKPEGLPEIPAPKSSGGLLGGWSAPKFTETDDWFTSRTAFLDGLENQLKALSKSIDVASRSRLDMAAAYMEVADALQALSESDLGSAMCASLAKLAELSRREKEGAEELAKGDVVNLLNMADEYVRFVGSVRRAMGGRVKVWLAWQAQEKELGRLKSLREKARVQGKLGDRAAQTLAEINEVDRRSRTLQQEYDTLTKLVKSEFGRFERERVDEFKRVLEKYLEDQMDRQREMVMAWEEYHVGVMGMVKKAQGVRSESVPA